MFTLRCAIIPLVCAELGFSTPHNMIQLDNHHGDHQKTNKQTNSTLPGCLSHAVNGMFHSVVVNQRRPQYI